MKYWDKEIIGNLNYEEAKNILFNNKFVFITRPTLNDVYFLNKKNKMCILEHNGNVLTNKSNILDKDKDDWTVVSATEEAIEQILKYTTISGVEEKVNNTSDESTINYEKRMTQLADEFKCKENEYNCKISEMTNDLIKYEREIEVLKAKMSVVEMIFSK